MHANDAERNLRGLRVILTILVLLWLLSAPAMTATLDDIRQANTANKSAISTARIVYTLELHDWSDRPERLEQPEETEGADLRRAREVTDGLNRHRLVHREIWCDLARQRARCEQTDLRDVDKLLEEAGLPPEQKANVSRSRAFLSGVGLYVFLRVPYQYMLVTSAPEPPEGENALRWAVKTGAIPPPLLEDDSAVTTAEVERDGLSLVELRISREWASWSILLDPDLGYRFRRFTVNRTDGRPWEERVADDYREVNGIPYPYSYVERTWSADGALTEEKTYIVEDVELNLALAPEDMQLLVPAGTFIQDGVNTEYAKVPANIQVDLDNVLGLAAKIKDQEKKQAAPPASQPGETPETQPAPDTQPEDTPETQPAPDTQPEDTPETQAAPDTQPSSETDDADPEPSPETRAVESAPPSSSSLLSILGVSIIVLALVAVVILRVRRSGARYGAE